MPAEPVVAFFDDSGGLDPGGGPIFALGMVVVRASSVKIMSALWLAKVAQHLKSTSKQLPLKRLEAKSSNLYALRDRLQSGTPITDPELNRLYQAGLNTATRVTAMIDDLWGMIASGAVKIKCLASAAKKKPLFQEFRATEYNEWKQAQKNGTKAKAAQAVLAQFTGERTFQFLLQRLEYLGEDEPGFPSAFVVGDQSAVDNMMFRTQAEAQAGLMRYTNLPKVANNVWFGSSLYNPGLQMADWVAFAVRSWAESKGDGAQRLKQIAPRFRGYPNILGQGIVRNPKTMSEWPKLER